MRSLALQVTSGLNARLGKYGSTFFYDTGQLNTVLGKYIYIYIILFIQTYLFITRDRRVGGCVVAEPITKAFLALPSPAEDDGNPAAEVTTYRYFIVIIIIIVKFFFLQIHLCDIICVTKVFIYFYAMGLGKIRSWQLLG